jgi:predicted metal-dependent enzyme (double-stranded beta helix superfamily)
MAAYPHDHRMWALIGLYAGREDNTFYRRSPEGLQVAGSKQLETGDTTLLGGGRDSRGAKPASGVHRRDPHLWW